MAAPGPCRKSARGHRRRTLSHEPAVRIRRPREAVLDHIGDGSDVSWFLSPETRAAFHRGDCDLVPNSFSDVPRLMRQSLSPPLVVTTVSAPDRHGYFSLGPDAEYTASFIGELPFFVEVNPPACRVRSARTSSTSATPRLVRGRHARWSASPRAPLDIDRRIAARIAERIPDGATLQVGIGAVPNAVLAELDGHRELGRPHETALRRRRRPGRVGRGHRARATPPIATRSSPPARSARSACSTSSPRTPGSSSGRSTTPTTRA